jgi:4-hydroxy-tetrahydrodipicolinate synthase
MGRAFPFLADGRLLGVKHLSGGGWLAGVYAATPTPLGTDGRPALGDVAALLAHVRRVGCHGALILGTTGEGPSFGLDERLAILEAAAAARDAAPGLRLLAGTGAAALPDAVALTRRAIELGYDAQVVLPPFYFKAIEPAGLTDWHLRLADAIGDEARVLLYHIPAVSGVAVPVETVRELRDAAPTVFVGIKDSSSNLEHTRELCAIAGLSVFTGTDSHLAECLAAGGAGAITALANVCGGLVRAVFDGGTAAQVAALSQARAIFETYPSVAAVKALVHREAGLPWWPVRPPLRDLRPEEARALAGELAALDPNRTRNAPHEAQSPAGP